MPSGEGQQETSLHHSSHRHLLKKGKVRPPATLDAIVVPTARPTDSLHRAADLARYHRCPLVALCSIAADAEATIKLAAKEGVTVLAVNMNELPPDLVPAFRTTAMLKGGDFERRTDTSLKRNLGLLLAVIAGWDNVVFLDDDIAVTEPDHLTDAVGQLAEFAAVGLFVDGFPDNSVVCHAYRDAGGAQDTFIGGGALAVSAKTFDSFFPNIYNEDWFFLLTETRLRQLTMTGSVKQAEYNPYSDPKRAVSEEFGDVLAEGVYWLLDKQQPLTDADAGHWRERLAERRDFIDQILDMTERNKQLSTVRKRQMVAALKAAKLQNERITPQLCVEYMEAWRTDREDWWDHIRHTRRKYTAGLGKMLADLGLTHRYHVAASPACNTSPGSVCGCHPAAGPRTYRPLAGAAKRGS
jgi:hypothetical protein